MLDSFLPESAIERAFVQSLNWDAKRLWRKCMFHLERSLDREHAALACAYMMQLACAYAKTDKIHHQRNTLL